MMNSFGGMDGSFHFAATDTTTPSWPPQCSNYTIDTNATRNAAYTVLGNSCDTFSPSSIWVRFLSPAGTHIANYSVHYSNCNTNSAGWYSGVYPSIPGDTISGTVCYAWTTNPCIYNNTISVTLCNSYYVFLLSSVPRCSLRYCTM